MNPKNKFLTYSNLVGAPLLGAALVIHGDPHVVHPMYPTAPTVLRTLAIMTTSTASVETFHVGVFRP